MVMMVPKDRDDWRFYSQSWMDNQRRSLERRIHSEGKGQEDLCKKTKKKDLTGSETFNRSMDVPEV